MLFKNLRSGNIVSVTDASSIALMRRSEMYEEICVDAVSDGDKEAEPKKRRPKTKK